MQHDNDNAPATGVAGGPRFLSVCSGIEAASVAWHPLGWQAVAFSEIEKFPSAVLAHHYPDVPNLGDFTKIDTTALGQVDVLCGGTPCQAFSVAGLRQSLADERGNLSLEFVRLVHELSAGNGLRNVIWENVCGVLNTKDNAFGCFLGGLVGATSAVQPPRGTKWPNAGMVSGPKGRAAWRVLDAQFFGLAQRRRRVLVVADFGNGADPAEVLLIQQGVQRHSAPSREAQKDVAGATASGAGTGGEYIGGVDYEGNGHGPDVPTGPLLKGSPTGGGHPLPAVAYSIQAGALRTILHRPDGVGVQSGVAYTLEARAEVQAVVWSIMPQNSGKDYKARQVDVAQPLMAGGPVGGNQGGDFIQQSVVAFNAEAQADQLPGAGRDTSLNDGLTVSLLAAVAIGADVFNGQLTGDVAATMGTRGSSTNASGPTVLTSAVRRLTPVECERLQGFPDDYTRIPWRNKPADQCPDGPRYKALGNSWAVPKFTWLGRRLQAALARRDTTHTTSEAA